MCSFDSVVWPQRRRCVPASPPGFPAENTAERLQNPPPDQSSSVNTAGRSSDTVSSVIRSKSNRRAAADTRSGCLKRRLAN